MVKPRLKLRVLLVLVSTGGYSKATGRRVMQSAESILGK
jgi:hypothetical protein